MRTIPLTQSQIALVDNADFEKLNKFKWYASKNRYGDYEAVRNGCRIGKGCRQKRIYMHRQIMNCPQEMEIDHHNHNKLDNQRINLRICTHSENVRNSRIPRNNTSGFKGVHWFKPRKKWRTQIRYNHKTIFTGLFNSKLKAAKAYDIIAKKYFGEFAYTNF